jgi:hypothetical protein
MNHLLKIEEYFNNLEIDLKEAMDNPLTIEWDKKDNEWVGTFSILENTNYVINIDNISKVQKIFLCKFTANGSYDMLNDVKKAFVTIPTIKRGVDDFINEIKPDAFIFFATDNSNSRKRFYTSFCVEYKNKGEYLFKEIDLNKYYFYILYKPEIDNDDFNKSFNKLVSGNRPI